MAILTIVGTGAGDLLRSTNGGPTELFGDVLPTTPNAETTPFGDDTLVGGPGNDTLYGQRGNDSLVGSGNDDLRGGAGRDTLIGSGNDTLFGNKDADMLFGGVAAFGGQGNDTIFGAANTVARGELGNDIIYGGLELRGGQGNDTLVASVSTARMFGNESAEDEFSADQFIFAPATRLTIAEQAITQGGFPASVSIEDFQSGPGLGDVIKLVNLDSGSRVVVSQQGADVRIVVTGTASPDTGAPEPQNPNSPTSRTQTVNTTITVRNTNVQQFLAVGSEDLLLEGVSVGGQVVLNTANMTTDSVNTNTVFSYVIGDRNGRRIDASNRTVGVILTQDFSNLQDPNGVFVFPSVNNDTIVATSGDDSIDGLAGSDLIEGRSGNDTLRGGPGNDTLVGGAADFAPESRDFLFGDAGNDLIYGDSLPGGTPPSEGKSLRDFIDGGDGNDTLFGQGGDDTILGGNGDDMINGGDGNDSLVGGAGDDTIVGELGNDTILGGDGNDVIDGGSGNDIIEGGAGNDSIYGASGNDTISGGDGRDTIMGGIGNDSIRGNAGDDTLFGDESEDTVRGDEGNDSIFGGDGNDLLDGGIGRNFIDGGSPDQFFLLQPAPAALGGNNLVDSTDPLVAAQYPTGVIGDVVSYKFATFGVTVNLAAGTATGGSDTINFVNDTLKSIEHVVGSNSNDVLRGDVGANLISGEGGNDSILGGGGNDQLFGGDGDDTVLGEDGNDTIWGGAGNDSLSGGAGDDSLLGGTGDDTLDGGTGNDTMVGGSGNDVYIVDNPGDVVNEEGGIGSFNTVVLTGGGVYTLAQHFTNIQRIEVNTSAPVTIPGQLAPIVVPTVSPINITFSGNAAVVFSATAGNDTLTGGDGDDQLNGADGNDTLVGGLGNDQLNGGTGNDSLVGGPGADTLTGGSGADTFDYLTGFGNSAGVNQVDTITDFNPNDGDRIRVPATSVFFDPNLDADGNPATLSNIGVTSNLNDVYTNINLFLPGLANQHFVVETTFGGVNAVFVAIADGTPGFTTGGGSQDTLIRLGSGVIAPVGPGNFLVG